MLCYYRMIKEFGPVVRYYFLFGRNRVLIADPDIMKHVLLTNSQNYIKPPSRLKYHKLFFFYCLVWTC